MTFWDVQYRFISFAILEGKRALNMSKKRVFLTLGQRIEVIESHEKGNSERKLSDIFGCGKTQINKILKDKVAIRKEWENFKFRDVKRMRTEKFLNINEALMEWFRAARAKNIPISGPLMKEKAMEIADALGIRLLCEQRLARQVSSSE